MPRPHPILLRLPPRPPTALLFHLCPTLTCFQHRVILNVTFFHCPAQNSPAASRLRKSVLRKKLCLHGPTLSDHISPSPPHPPLHPPPATLLFRGLCFTVPSAWNAFPQISTWPVLSPPAGPHSEVTLLETSSLTTLKDVPCPTVSLPNFTSFLL